MPTYLRVQVLATDPRTVQSARALPTERFGVGFSSDRLHALSRTDRGCDVAIAELGLEGFAFAKDIRDRPYGESVAIVLLCDRKQDEWLCKQAGADEVIVKPLLDTTTLLRAVDAAVSAKTSN